MRLALAALLALSAFLGAARAEVAVPPLKSRVTDLTGTLSAPQKAELEARIAAFESRRGSQLAVLLLPTTKPEEIEQFSIRVAEAWKIGRKKVDDGLILVVAKDDRRLRIEVGYGLEGAIPDALAKRVIDEKITPRFRDGDFYGGVRDGVDQLIRLAEGEKLPAPPPQPVQRRQQENPSTEPLGFFQHLFASNPLFIVIVAIFGGLILKGLLGRLGGSIATAAAIGVLTFIVFGVGAALMAAVIAFIITFTNTGGGGGSGYSSGGSSWGGSSGGFSSGSSGGSSGGSSYSGGGGGSFGGGGASGRW
jgi:uncharacterized protein